MLSIAEERDTTIALTDQGIAQEIVQYGKKQQFKIHCCRKRELAKPAFRKN
jgi:hypothetical protein